MFNSEDLGLNYTKLNPADAILESPLKIEKKKFEYIPLRNPLEVADLPIRLGTHFRKLEYVKAI